MWPMSVTPDTSATAGGTAAMPAPAAQAARSCLRIAAAIRPEQVAAAIRGSSGETDAVRRLRVSHPGLGLRHAYDLYQHYERERR